MNNARNKRKRPTPPKSSAGALQSGVKPDASVDLTRLLDIVAHFPRQTICVVGDFVLDEFVSGEISRVSREAPVLILRHRRTESYPGGAANAVINLADLGARVLPVGVVGDDEGGRAAPRSFSPQTHQRLRHSARARLDHSDQNALPRRMDAHHRATSPARGPRTARLLSAEHRKRNRAQSPQIAQARRRRARFRLRFRRRLPCARAKSSTPSASRSIRAIACWIFATQASPPPRPTSRNSKPPITPASEPTHASSKSSASARFATWISRHWSSRAAKMAWLSSNATPSRARAAHSHLRLGRARGRHRRRRHGDRRFHSRACRRRLLSRSRASRELCRRNRSDEAPHRHRDARGTEAALRREATAQR